MAFECRGCGLQYDDEASRNAHELSPTHHSDSTRQVIIDIRKMEALERIADVLETSTDRHGNLLIGVYKIDE